MPVTYFRVRWPDLTESNCYSPSSVVTDYFDAGQDYPLDEFMRRARLALSEASERVRAKYGYACTAAMAELEAMESTARRWQAAPGASVRLIGFDC
ncbi:hypothetical protein D3C87_980740 [compost metagenome]|jgi:uncharacterized repeat protein (TIGR04042 family)|uniref:MSMEG_0570 family nitrogen starvation response protein n=1 Tax=Cupriavidus campinensis TaxID=151783 RepID=A0AAE9I4S7_9BURK|nr:MULTISPECIES: MSMEG_0570 family nitrogen starvation response protein [Cupriavidus]TSP11923.1 MSMEG_0570 family nitrogen starvation response protein [Cupriavidus campinensis]URF07442.1 MSMEG_0570 family nitrogen starvation response protein [Cupriavidus campinensis]CAG2139502.1 hypothetical protein LMG19282_01648 [Cupriavidus campinensis]